MSNAIAYFKTQSGRTSLKWIAVLLILGIVAYFYFRRVKSPDSDNPLVHRVEAQNDSLRAVNAIIQQRNVLLSTANDSLLIELASKQTLIEQKTVYVDREVIKWRDASANEIENFLKERYK